MINQVKTHYMDTEIKPLDLESKLKLYIECRDKCPKGEYEYGYWQGKITLIREILETPYWLQQLVYGEIIKRASEPKFTGLYDKHKQPIYENNCVRTKSGRICAVVYKSTPSYQGWDLLPVETQHDAPSKYDLWLPNNLELVSKEELKKMNLNTKRFIVDD